MPSAGPKRANKGNEQKSTSPRLNADSDSTSRPESKDAVRVFHAFCRAVLPEVNRIAARSSGDASEWENRPDADCQNQFVRAGRAKNRHDPTLSWFDCPASPQQTNSGQICFS